MYQTQYIVSVIFYLTDDLERTAQSVVAIVKTAQNENDAAKKAVNHITASSPNSSDFRITVMPVSGIDLKFGNITEIQNETTEI